MGIKFNCSNPACRQRIAVDEAMLGKTIVCPLCATELQVPASATIRFSCSNPACGQHISVDVSEAGRFVECPACAKAQSIPGSPPQSIAQVSKAAVINHRRNLTQAIEGTRYAPVIRLALGWGSGLLLAAIVISCLNIISRSGLPANLDEKSDEIYNQAVGEFRNSPIQTMGTNVLFLKYKNNDVSILSLNPASSQISILKTIKNVTSDMGFQWIGLSPRKDLIAYCAKGAKHNAAVFLLDGNEARTLKKVQLPTKEGVQSGWWLSGDSLVLMLENGEVYLLNLEQMGTFWRFGREGLNELFAATNGLSPMAMVSDHALAYIEEDKIMEFDILTGQTTMVTQMGGFQLSDLDFDDRNQMFLFTARVGSWEGFPGVYECRLADPKVKCVYMGGFGAHWAGGKEGGFVFLSEDNGERRLNWKDGLNCIHTNIFNQTHQNLLNYVVSDDGTAEYGIEMDDRAASHILRYSFEAGHGITMAEVQAGLKLCRMQNEVEGVVTNEAGQTVHYYYIPPAMLEPRKKYPVFMDMTSSSRHDHGWDTELLVNNGIFYVSPNKPGITKWGVTPKYDDVLATYMAMTNNLHVDPRRIYIAGQSITGAIARDLVQDHPGLWRGLIMIEPVFYPALPRAGEAFPSIFISMGDADEFNGISMQPGRAENFDRSVCAQLGRIRIYYQSNTGHAYQPLQFKKSYEQVVNFICSDF